MIINNCPVSPAPGAQSSKMNIPGLVRILPVPGHGKSKVSVEELDDGTYRALEAADDGSVRVVGIVARWPNMPEVSGMWAISASPGNRVAIFAVRKRTVPTKQCLCQGA